MPMIKLTGNLFGTFLKEISWISCVILNVWKVLMGNSLKEKDIPSVSYYSVPIHLQPVFENHGYNVGDFSVAEKVANEYLSLPMSPYLTQEDQAKVINVIMNKFK